MISIVIPVFNQSIYTKACLTALVESRTSEQQIEVIIVDNCSSDDTSDIIKDFLNKKLLPLKYVKNEKNLGFTIASNQGARLAQGDILVFLNNDTIPQSGWIEQLYATLQKPSVGIAGPRLLYPGTMRVNHAGYVFNPRLGGFYHLYHNYSGDFPAVLKPRSFQALLGACLMIRREVFERLNGFSEIGLEDIDLCLRVREKGLSVEYVPSALVLHHGSVTQNNSVVGSIPVYTSQKFSERWIERGLKWDDYCYYIEDGILNPVNSELAQQSYDLLKKALGRNSYKSENPSEELIKKAIAFYPGNTEALSELAILYIEKNDLKQAFEVCSEILKQGADFSESLVFVAAVYRKLNLKDELLKVASKIKELRYCSSDTLDVVREMLL